MRAWQGAMSTPLPGKQGECALDRDRLFVIRHVAIGAAALLIPGIEPVFLDLLASAHGTALAEYGWIASADQIGMAIGAVMLTMFRRASSNIVATFAGVGALVTAALTVHDHGFAVLMVLRILYGACAGLLLGRSILLLATRGQAERSLGAIFTFQLLAASLGALCLPVIAEHLTPRFALALLALAPLVMAAALLPDRATREAPLLEPRAASVSASITPANWMIEGALFLVLCAIMMIWSYVGALGEATGLNDQQVGIGVGIGSLFGLVASGISSLRPGMLATGPAIVAMSAAMAAPLLQFSAGADFLIYLVALCLFNIGCTGATIVYSAVVIEKGPTHGARRVPAIQAIGMIVGPAIGSGVADIGGLADVLIVGTIIVGLAALLHLAGTRGGIRSLRLLPA